VTKALRLCVFAALILIAFARPAAADWHLTPFIGLTLGGSTTFVTDTLDPDRAFGRNRWVYGGSISYVGRGLVGVEALVAYVPGIFERDLGLITGSRSVAAMGNVVLTPPRAWNEHGLRAFVSGGFGLLHVRQEFLQDALPVNRNVLGYNVGGGAVGFVTDATGIRFDVRHFSYVKSADTEGVSLDREKLSYWTAAVGVVLRFPRGPRLRPSP
jgi:hypothetical protein